MRDTKQNHGPEQRARQRGFTLLELVIAMAVAGIMVAIAMQDYERVAAEHELDNYQRKIIALYRNARFTALGESIPVVFGHSTVAVNDYWLFYAIKGRDTDSNGTFDFGFTVNADESVTFNNVDPIDEVVDYVLIKPFYRKYEVVDGVWNGQATGCRLPTSGGVGCDTLGAAKNQIVLLGDGFAYTSQSVDAGNPVDTFAEMMIYIKRLGSTNVREDKVVTLGATGMVDDNIAELWGQ